MPYVELQTFLDAIAVLTDLWRRKLLRFGVAPQGGVALVWEDEAMTERPAPGGGLYFDLEDAINAAAADTPVDRFVDIRMQSGRGLGREDPDVARQKFEAAKKLVEEAQIREILQFSMTAKVPILAAHDWEVVNRIADSSQRPGTRVARYAVVRLTTERRSAIDWTASQDVTVIALDEQKLGSLIDDLHALRDALPIRPAGGRPHTDDDSEESGHG
ncbi:MAG: hypothetical protein ACLP1Q_20825 [Solirubrobacteraceae bacterium]